jgi:hypothetical protein
VKRSTRLGFMMTLALLAACGTEPTQPLEGLWIGFEPGRFNHWEIRFRDEGGGVIGRAKESLGGHIMYSDVPVTGLYPRVQFETGFLNDPLDPPDLANRHAVFVGALRSKCPGDDGPCVIGTVTKFSGARVLSSDTVEFHRAAE